MNSFWLRDKKSYTIVLSEKWHKILYLVWIHGWEYTFIGNRLAENGNVNKIVVFGGMLGFFSLCSYVFPSF